VAAVHAGWRGSAADVAGTAVRALRDALGADRERLVAVIGPHIGPCCYEVDAPVRRAISDDGVFGPGRDGRHWNLDLGALNRSQLERAGLSPAAIHWAGGCTACQPEQYPSHRRDGTDVRMIHWVRVALP
jgi:copper oxidase (laccase) domain-containing protein